MLRDIIAPLCKLVVDQMIRLQVPPEELLTGPITITNLPWQTPALICEATVGGVPLSEYLDRPASVNVEALYSFWCSALANMLNDPNAVGNRNGWHALSTPLNKVNAGERKYLITLPDGFPEATNPYAGVTLSLECAHILRNSVHLKDFIEDESNYLAVTHDGREIGVKDGFPAQFASMWDTSAEGMVQILLRSPRGETWNGCDYDLLAKLRSVVHLNIEKISDFEGIDWALQALRVLSDGKHLKQLIWKAQRMKLAAAIDKNRLIRWREAAELLPIMSMSDRAKVLSWRQILVPDILTMGEFNTKFWNTYHTIPATLTERTVLRIEKYINQQISIEESKYANKAKLS